MPGSCLKVLRADFPIHLRNITKAEEIFCNLSTLQSWKTWSKMLKEVWRNQLRNLFSVSFTQELKFYGTFWQIVLRSRFFSVPHFSKVYLYFLDITVISPKIKLLLISNNFYFVVINRFGDLGVKSKAKRSNAMQRRHQSNFGESYCSFFSSFTSMIIQRQLLFGKFFLISFFSLYFSFFAFLLTRFLSRPSCKQK